MFKKTVRYKNFNDEVVEKDFYFHLSKAELLELAADGNAMETRLKKIIAEKNNKAILREFRDLIMSSCGVRSEDGERFIKTPEAQSQLLDSPAYDELLMELCTSADEASKFIRQLLPEEMAQQMADQMKKGDAQLLTRAELAERMQAGNTGQETRADVAAALQKIEDDWPAWKKEQREPTEAEVRDMTPEQLRDAFRSRISKKL